MNEVKAKTDSLLAAFEGNFCMIFSPSPGSLCPPPAPPPAYAAERQDPIVTLSGVWYLSLILSLDVFTENRFG